MTEDQRDALEYAKADARADETRDRSDCPLCHGSGNNCPACADWDDQDEPEIHDDDDD